MRYLRDVLLFGTGFATAGLIIKKSLTMFIKKQIDYAVEHESECLDVAGDYRIVKIVGDSDKGLHMAFLMEEKYFKED